MLKPVFMHLFLGSFNLVDGFVNYIYKAIVKEKEINQMKNTIANKRKWCLIKQST